MYALRSQGLLLEPSEGEIPPAASTGGSGSLVITAALTADSAGALGGDINVQLTGLEEPKKISFSATGVKHTFDLVESSGALLSEVCVRVILWGLQSADHRTWCEQDASV